MTRAPYDRTALATLRTLRGIHASASALRWSPEEVRRIAAKHAIEMVDDTPADSGHEPAASAAPAVSPISIPARRTPAKSDKPKKVRPVRFGRGGRSPNVAGHPRRVAFSCKLSDAATAALEAIAKSKGIPASAALSVAADYAARHGFLSGWLKDALNEMEWGR